MRKTMSFLAAVVFVGALASGCANVERKFGRGLTNMYEIVRGGEWRRSMEQTAVLEGPQLAYTTGFMSGINKTLVRTGLGMYEVVTAPIPPYGPVCTDYLTPNPAYPDNYTPKLLEDSLFATDVNLGFSGGDVAPGIPGSRFRIFDAH